MVTAIQNQLKHQHRCLTFFFACHLPKKSKGHSEISRAAPSLPTKSSAPQSSAPQYIAPSPPVASVSPPVTTTAAAAAPSLPPKKNAPPALPPKQSSVSFVLWS
jgi:hypothetical protein